MNKMVLVSMSWMRKMNGRLSLTVGTSGPTISVAVAAVFVDGDQRLVEDVFEEELRVERHSAEVRFTKD